MIQLLKNKKTWLQNSDNHLEDQLVGDQDAGAATKKKTKFKYVQKKKDQIQKTMQEDGDWYFHQASGTFTFELFSY